MATDHHSEGSQTPMTKLFSKIKFSPTVSVAVKITAIYFAVGILWIIFSDAALGLVVRDPSVMTKLAMSKGCFYVSLTALMLYVLVRRWTAGMARDIAERRQAEQALQESETNLSRAQEIAHIGSWHLDIAGNQLTWSNEVYRLFDIPKGTALSYEAFLDTVHPEDRERVNRAWTAALQGAPYDIEHRILIGGESRWVRERAEVEFDRQGKAVKGIGTVQDITELKRAEEAVREERQRLFDVLETLPIMVSLLKPDYRVAFANRSFREKFGEAHNRHCYEYRFGNAEPCSFCETTEVFETGRSHHWEFTGPEGSVIDAHSFPFTDVDGSPMVLEMHMDITERRRAEESLSRLNRELRAISNCNQSLLRATDEQSLLDEICRIVCEEAGYRMAWVGYAENDEARSVRPAAWAGAEGGYLATAGITWADTERGRGPAGTAIRSGKSCCIQDYATDPGFAPWRESALQRGFRSGIVLPLKDEDAEVFGCLCIDSEQSNAFTPEEIRLLEELAADLAFGVVTLRSQAARKRAEQEVALLNFALDKIGEGAFLIDETGCFQYVNEESCRVLGYTREEMLDLGVSDIDPDFPAERWSEHWRDLRAKRSLTFESRHRTRDGHIFPVEVSTNHFEYGGGAYNLALARDITERKRAEEALRRTQAYLAEGERLSHTGSWAVDLDKYIYCSEEDLRIWGLDPHGPLPSRKAVFRQMHPEDWDRVEESFLKTFREKVDTSCEYRIVLPDGSVRHVHVVRHPVLNEAGEVFQLVGITIDITERKRAEEALRLASAYNRSLIEASLDPLVTIDPQGRISDVNAATEQVTGCTRSELIGTDFSEYFTEPEKARAVYQQVFEQGFVSDYELEIRGRNGEITLVLYNASAYRDDAGSVIGVFAAARDITELKHAERARSMLAAIVESSDDAIISKDLDGTITSWNAGAQRLYFYSAAEVLGKPITFLLPPDQQDEIAGFLERIREGGRIEHYETKRVRKDGRKIHVSLTLSPVRNHRGQIIGASSIARDVTELKRAQNEVLSHLRFLQNMDRINRAIQGTNDLEQMMSDVLEAMLLIFDSDRAWLVYPCDPDAASWRVAMERTKPEYPGGFALASDIPMNPETRTRFQLIADGPGVVTFGQGCDHPLSGVVPESFGHKSQVSIALHPKMGKPWVLGMQQCSYPRVWTQDEKKLLEEIARRVTDVLTGLLANRDLHESEERHRVVLQTAMDGFFLADMQGRILEVNETYCRMTGYSEQELLTMSIADLSVVRTVETIAADIKRLMELGPERFESVHRRKDGSLFDVEISGQYQPIAGGQAVVFVRDITERKRAEEALRQSEAYLTEAQRVTHTGSFAYQPGGSLRYWSEETLRIWGFDQQVIPDHEMFRQRIHPEDRGRVRARAEASVGTKTDWDDEFRIVLPDGTVKHIRGIHHPVFNASGELIEVLGTHIDITEHKRAEETLRRSEAYLNEAQRLSHTGSWALDVATGNYDYWSEETFRIYEFDPREGFPTKEEVYRRIHPEDWKGAEESFQKSIRQKVDTLDEFRSVLPSGTVKHIQVIGHPVLNDAGDVVQLVGTTMDITERKRAEKALQNLLSDLEARVDERTKKLSEANQSLQAANRELESFSYSVSHDLRAPLRAIDGFSMMVLKEYADKLDDEGRRKLNVIRSNSQQMGKLIDDLLTFSRMGRKEMANASLDMEAIVRSAWKELTQLNPERRIQFSVQRLPHGTGDQALIKEVVVNLLSNAVKFTKYREHAIVEVGAWPGKETNVYFVKDNGAGFDMQYYDKLFGVFQRLHSTDEFEGTGVGLAIVERIIGRHGGRVWAEGKEGEGATFYFTLTGKDEP